MSVPITISGQSTISQFNSVTISGLTHNYYGDLRAFISNGTTTVQLFANSSSPDNASFSSLSAELNGTYTFAPTGSDWYSQENPVPSGTYASLGDLSAFNGDSLNGTWTLNIQDREIIIAGSFTEWSFDVTPTPAAVPEPRTLTMLGAVAALGFSDFFKRKLGKGKKSNKA